MYRGTSRPSRIGTLGRCTVADVPTNGLDDVVGEVEDVRLVVLAVSLSQPALASAGVMYSMQISASVRSRFAIPYDTHTTK